MTTKIQADLRVESEPFSRPGIAVIDTVTKKEVSMKPGIPRGPKSKTGAIIGKVVCPTIIPFLCHISLKMGVGLHEARIRYIQRGVLP
jgi:hypothetical protein